MFELSLTGLRTVALATTFLAVGTWIVVVLRSRTERANVRAALGDLSAGDLAEAMATGTGFGRGIGTAVGRIGRSVTSLGPSGLMEQVEERLVLAGLSHRLSPDAFMALSLATPIVTGACIFAVNAMYPLPVSLWVVVPVSAAFPKMWLTKRVEARRHAIRLALPDTLDLMTIAVEAGLGFDAAVARVVGSIPGPLSDELYRMLQEVRLGIPRQQAFLGLSRRTDVEELDQFITAMNQADTLGISIGKVLRVQAAQLRRRRSQVAEERAAKTPVKLLFPLLVCIFPALFTVIVGPAALRIMERMLVG